MEPNNYGGYITPAVKLIPSTHTVASLQKGIATAAAAACALTLSFSHVQIKLWQLRCRELVKQ